MTSYIDDYPEVAECAKVIARRMVKAQTALQLSSTLLVDSGAVHGDAGLCSWVIEVGMRPVWILWWRIFWS
jgi:hypothetical protein